MSCLLFESIDAYDQHVIYLCSLLIKFKNKEMNLINAQCDTIKLGYTEIARMKKNEMLKEIHAEFVP